MKRKTINTTISKKMEEWRQSLKDEKLKAGFYENVIVTGGCIPSMYLGEAVNDFDVYIKSMDYLISLAKYYLDPLQIDVLDGRLKESYMKDYNPDIDPEESDGYNAMLYVRRRTLHPDQVKVDVASYGKRFYPQLDSDGKEIPYRVVHVSQNAISLTSKIQIVTRFTGDPDQIHKNYDFIHATSYWTKETKLVTSVPALESILNKDLKYQGSLYPITSVIRMRKFMKRGWSINAGEILKILFQVSELDLKNVDVLEEQLIGVDIAYFSKLLEVLRGISTDKYTSAYISSLIDKIFGEEEGEDENA